MKQKLTINQEVDMTTKKCKAKTTPEKSVRGRKSRDKGKRGERELASELQRLFGVAARRGVQYHGGSDSPDVVSDFDSIHFEVKRTEKLSLYPAMQQAVNDAGAKVPVVCHRPNNKEWLAIVRLNDLPQLAAVIENHLRGNIHLTQETNHEKRK